MIIVGAGLSGLLAGRILASKFVRTEILERQHALPNNHAAVLRFRSSVVGDRTSIPFRKVNMIKCHHPVRNPVADALTYSMKVSGTYRSDRSIVNGFESGTRYIAPENFISQLASDLDIKYGADVNLLRIAEDNDRQRPILSTLPMPTLMTQLDYQGQMPNFRSISGWSVRFTIEDCDAYSTVYDPHPDSPIARVSITGNEVICECLSAGKHQHEFEYFEQAEQLWVVSVMNRACELLGIERGGAQPTVTKMKYAKILPIDDKVRKDFLHWATETYNIYSLGRFATWRPGLLLDDLVQDIDHIHSWARNSSYLRKKSQHIASMSNGSFLRANG